MAHSQDVLSFEPGHTTLHHNTWHHLGKTHSKIKHHHCHCQAAGCTQLKAPHIEEPLCL